MKWIVFLFVAATLGGCLADEPAPVVEPEPIVPVASIEWSPAAPEPREEVQFSFTSNVNVTAASWSFGDGTSAVQLAPIHAYFKEGWKEVTLQLDTEVGLVEAKASVPVASTEDPIPPQEPEPEPTESAGEITITHSLDQNVASFGFQWNLEPTAISWDFGDGTTSSKEAPVHAYGRIQAFEVTLQLVSGSESAIASTTVNILSLPFIPHVIVGIPDSGANPYHSQFYRPDLTAHPCEYIESFPCSVQELPLTVGTGLSYQEAVTADEELWSSMVAGQFYWIPRTSFVAFGCEAEHDNKCGLDDGSQVHGTGTTGSVQTEAPGALLAFKEGGSGIQAFLDAGIPVDIFSVSWGWADPVVGLSVPLPLCGPNSPLYVKSAGNEPGLSTLPDCWTSHPSVMSVGGAYAADNSQYVASGKESDFVSYYCRPAPDVGKTTGDRDWCGTSFGGPTAAGAIAKTLLAIRTASGYTGTLSGGAVDPIAGISVADFRTALELTASYSPEASYGNTDLLAVPLNPVLPCAQWGWGFLDGKVADATIAHLSGGEQGTKSAQCVAYMDAIAAAKESLHG